MPDMTPPDAPSNVSAQVVDTDRDRLIMAVQWMDNCIWEDEYFTLFTFRDLPNNVVVTAAVYAIHYDQPSGSTGQRQANVIIPRATGVTLVAAQSVRLVTMNDGTQQAVWSGKSPRATIGSPVLVSIPKPQD